MVTSRNDVKITGTVVNTYKIQNKDVLTMTIMTDAAGKKRNYPKVVWYDKKSAEALEILKTAKNQKPKVSITGYVQTTKSKRSGKTEYHQNIVGKTLSLPSTSIEALLEMGTVNRSSGSENEVIIVGELVNKFNFNKKNSKERLGTTIKIKTGDSIPNYPEISLFREQSDEAQKIECGETVAIVGSIQTDKRIDPATGKTIHHETIVAKELLHE